MSAQQRREPFSGSPTESTYLPKVRFAFPFNLIEKLTMASLTGQSLGILKSWYTVEDFGSGSQTVNQSEALATKFLEDMYFPLTFQPVE